jgi:hypothetical protein
MRKRGRGRRLGEGDLARMCSDGLVLLLVILIVRRVPCWALLGGHELASVDVVIPILGLRDFWKLEALVMRS